MKKLLPQTSSALVQGSGAAQPSKHVCMYVRGPARTDNRVMREATALVNAGHIVSIIDVECDPALPAEEELSGVSIKHVIMPSWDVPTRFKPWFLVKTAQLFVRSVCMLMQVKADVYHAHDDTALPACYLASRVQGKPLVFDAHELPLLQRPVSEMNGGQRFLHAISARFLPYMIARSTAVITVSAPIARYIQKRYRVSNVTLVRNIPAYQVVSQSDRLRLYLGLSQDTRIVLYQGVIHSDRGLDKLIQVAKFLAPDIVIVIMGNGSREVISNLEALIVSEQVADRVKIVPAVPYEELLNWTASADIGVIIYSPDYSMNVRMCLPNKLFEYLMAGLPVLSSQLDAIAEVLTNYSCGQIVASLAPEDVAAAINSMLIDREAVAQMRRNALEATRREFQWEKESQSLVHLYHDILDKRSKVCIHIPRSIHADSRVMREATALVEAGLNVSIVDVENERSGPYEEDVQGIAVQHISNPSWDVPTRFKPWFLVKMLHMTVLATMRLLRTQADIYQAYEERALPACYIVACLRRKPLIFDSPELPLSYPNVTRWSTLHALSTQLLALMIRRCQGAIAVSPPIVEEMRTRYHIPEVRLIRNLPAYQLVPKNDRLRQYIGLQPDTRIALYQGNIQVDRGLDNLIRAAIFLEQNTVIVLMGEGPEEMLSQLGALIESQEVADRVKIIPAVPYEELLDWTASADMGLIVLPPQYSLSIRMCLPNKFFEYLMAGLPVLSSQLDVVVHLIKTHDVGQVVSSLTPTAIAAKINEMLMDKVALERMHNNALHVAQEFCWEKERSVLVHLYHDVLTKWG